MFVLGSVLRDNRLFDDVRAVLSPDDFYYAHHRTVFRVVEEAVAGGKPMDAALLFSRLKELGELDNVGGAVAIGDLFGTFLVERNAVEYARLVREKATARRLIALCSEMIRDAYSPADENMAALVARFETQIFAVADGAAVDEPVTLRDAALKVVENIDARHRGEGCKPIPTGIPGLDMVIGGLHPHQLTIVAARPGAGKSAAALTFALAAGEAGVGAIVFSMEMAASEWAARAMANKSSVPLNCLTGSAKVDERTARKLWDGMGSMGVPVWIDERADHTVHTIAATARRAVRKHKVGLIIIDYLQLIDHGGHRQDSMADRVGHTSRALKILAKTLRVPVVCLSQLNRESEKRADKRPTMADLRASGSIEQDADNVILLWPQQTGPQFGGDKVIRLCVDKQRNGPAGVEVETRYVGEFTRFEAAGGGM